MSVQDFFTTVHKYVLTLLVHLTVHVKTGLIYKMIHEVVQVRRLFCLSLSF